MSMTATAASTISTTTKPIGALIKYAQIAPCRSEVRFPQAALRSFGLTSALFWRILEGQLGLV
jgi:hypothetical protein